MTPEERKKRQRRLEETYYQEKRMIAQKQQQLDEDLTQFRKETAQLMDKVAYLTKHDTWDKRKFYSEIEQSESRIRHEARRFIQHLAEEQQKLTKNYQCELATLDKSSNSIN